MIICLDDLLSKRGNRRDIDVYSLVFVIDIFNKFFIRIVVSFVCIENKDVI